MPPPVVTHSDDPNSQQAFIRRVTPSVGFRNETPISSTAFRFPGAAHVVDACESGVLTSEIKILRAALGQSADEYGVKYLAFDAEWDVNKIDGQIVGSDTGIQLLQLCVGCSTPCCVLIQTHSEAAAGVGQRNAELRNLFADKTITFRGYNSGGDRKRMKQMLSIELADEQFVDLFPLAKARLPNLSSHSLATVVQATLQGALSKAQQQSQWSGLQLTQAQIAYAAADAYVLLKLRTKLADLPDVVRQSRDLASAAAATTATSSSEGGTARSLPSAAVGATMQIDGVCDDNDEVTTTSAATAVAATTTTSSGNGGSMLHVAVDTTMQIYGVCDDNDEVPTTAAAAAVTASFVARQRGLYDDDDDSADT